MVSVLRPKVDANHCACWFVVSVLRPKVKFRIIAYVRLVVTVLRPRGQLQTYAITTYMICWGLSVAWYRTDELLFAHVTVSCRVVSSRVVSNPCYRVLCCVFRQADPCRVAAGTRKRWPCRPVVSVSHRGGLDKGSRSRRRNSECWLFSNWPTEFC